MRGLMDTVELDHDEHGTTVTLARRLDGAGHDRVLIERIDGIRVARPRGDIDAANASQSSGNWPRASSPTATASCIDLLRPAISTAPRSTCCSVSAIACDSGGEACRS